MAERPLGAESADFFRDKYLTNGWGGKRSRSGQGSEGWAGRQKRRLVLRALRQHGARRVLDVGCGDLLWMRPLLPRLERYLGVDLVPELVEASRTELARAGLEHAEVRTVDAVDPAAWSALAAKGEFDLVLCFDVLGHLLVEEVDLLLRFLLETRPAPLVMVTNRRDATSEQYLERPKTRSEGIDIEAHPRFRASSFARIESTRAWYPGDWIDLYRET